MAVEMTLVEKVQAIVDDLDATVLSGSRAPFDTGEHEYDAADWQLYYGIAIGLARPENPFESRAGVARRARETACQAFLALNGDSGATAAVRAELVALTETVA